MFYRTLINVCYCQILLWSLCSGKKTAMDHIVNANWNHKTADDGTPLWFTDIRKTTYRQVSESPRSAQDAVIKMQDSLWPGAVIPYTIDPSLGSMENGNRTVKDAMSEWERKTCIRFVERSNEIDYVEFVATETGCNADVGRKQGKQTISLGDGCLHTSVVVHEIGHVIGFWHEQNRPDRDQYVTILTDNIQDHFKDAFAMFSKYRIDSLGVEYDYHSIMHYGTKAFTKNGQPTILPKRKDIYSLGNDELSPLDIKQASLLYKCDERVNRGWTSWTHWTKCNVSCGGGHQERTRVCTSLQDGKQQCKGAKVQMRVCNAQKCPDWPKFPEDFSFDHLRFDRNKQDECILTYERADYQEWNSYSFCNSGKRQIGMRWSDEGEVEGMKCTRIFEKKEHILKRWYDNYLCVPPEVPYNFIWSYEGKKEGLPCVQWYAKEGRDGWNDNYLCLDGEKTGVKKGDEPIDGQWGEWSSWSPCTKSCGKGKKRRLRLCNKPQAMYGGKVCDGAFFQDEDCLEMPCPVVKSCGGILNGPKGSLTSPNYPSNYPSHTNCSWHIRGSEGKRIVLVFQTFDFEKLFEGPCKFDYLHVRDKDENGKDLGKFCGDKVPQPIASVGSSLWVNMITDSNDNKAGFRASWETIDARQEGCGGTIRGTSGTIQSPNYPRPYPKERTCVWKIEVPKQHFIHFKFLHFDLEHHKVCKYDSLTIYDGYQRNAPQLGRYCDNKAIGSIKTQTGKALVKFVSDHSTEKSGFKIRWKAVHLNRTKSSGDANNIKGTRGCPKGWSYFMKDIEGGACYIVKRNYFNWYGARDDCLSNNADLVSITTKAEQDYVTNDLLRGNYMWLGLTDKDNEGRWAWSDNTTRSDFKNWDTGDPNDGGRFQNEDCALIKPNGKWNDYPCDDRFNYICKRRPFEKSVKKTDEASVVVNPDSRPSNPLRQTRQRRRRY